MPGIQGIQPQSVSSDHALPNEAVRNARAPAELANARPSRAAVAGRVMLGIITLGISEGIRAAYRACRPARAPVPRVEEQMLPPTEPAEDIANRALAEQIRRGTTDDAARAAILEALGSFREAFPQEFDQQGLEAVPFKDAFLKNLQKAVVESAELVTPQILSALARSTAQPLVGQMLLARAVQGCCEASGLTSADTIRMLPDQLLELFPELAAALKGASDIESFNRVISENLPKIRNHIELIGELDRAEQSACERVINGLTQATGIDKSVIRQNLSLSKLESQITYLRNDILTGEKSLRGDDLIGAFHALADRFIAVKAQLFDSLRRDDIAPEVREYCQNSILTESTLSRGNIYDISARLAVNIDTTMLTEALRNRNEFTNADVLGVLLSLSLKMESALVETLGPIEWNDLGGDGKSEMRFNTALAVLNNNAELRALLSADPERIEQLSQLISERQDQAMNLITSSHQSEVNQGQFLYVGAVNAEMLFHAASTISGHNHAFIEALNSGKLPAMHADAALTALADLSEAFPGSLPAIGLSDLLNLRAKDTGKTGAEAIKAAAETAEGPFLAQSTRMTVRENLRGTAALGTFRSLIKAIAEQSGQVFTETQTDAVMRQLRARHPDLNAQIGAAENADAVARIIEDLPETSELVRVQLDIQTAWDEGYREVYARMAELTGSTPQQMQEVLNITKINQGGRFGILRKALSELGENPAMGTTQPFPTIEQIRTRFGDIVESFIESKTALWRSVDTLSLQPEVATAWKNDVLTNSALSQPDFLVNCAAVARSMTTAGLETALASPGLSDSELLVLFSSIGKQLNDLSHDIFGADRMNRIDSHERSVITQLTSQAYLSEHPELKDAVRAHPETVDRILSMAQNRLNEEMDGIMSIEDVDSPELLAHRKAYAYYGVICSLIGDMKDTL